MNVASLAETVLSEHWLLFDNNGKIVACQCAFIASGHDEGYGDSILRHIIDVSAEQLASQIEEARAYDYASRPRRMTGWTSAANEIRRIARR